MTTPRDRPPKWWMTVKPLRAELSRVRAALQAIGDCRDPRCAMCEACCRAAGMMDPDEHVPPVER
jgi:hypothetical protein